MSFNLGKLLPQADGKKETSIDTSVESNVSIDKKNALSGSGINSINAKKGSNVNINIINIQLPENEEARLSYAKKLLREFNSGEAQFIEKESIEDLIDCKETSTNEENELEKLNDIIPRHDIFLIRTGLYIKKLNESGEVSRAKRVREQATKNASQRSRNVINLASAGFYENYIIPLCENKTNDDAIEMYNEITKDLPGIVFVNSNMDEDDVLKIVRRKIEEKENYHLEVKNISVNGLQKCCEIIKNVRDVVKQDYPNYLTTLMERDEENHIKRCELKIKLDV